MPDEPTILVDRNGTVSTITLNSPEALNAFTEDMASDFTAAMTGEVEAGARALIVTGAGRAFCAGANLAGDDMGTGKFDVVALMEKTYKPLVRAFSESPVPIVTAVNGVAAGAGASLAFAGDIILAARSAQFVYTFANLGLCPDLGGTWLVARSAGRVRALEMALLAGKISAEKAERCNLVTEVVDDEQLMDHAAEVASKLARMPTKSLALIRQQVRLALETSFEASLDVEAQNQAQAVKTSDFSEGVTAFAERRKPVFTGR